MSSVTTAASSTTAATIPVTTLPPAIQESVREAVIAHQEDRGVESFRYEVRNLLLSPSDQTWARFNIAPSQGNEAVFQGQYGVAHFDGTSWTIVAVGISGVGCPPTEIPSAVRQTLQLGC